MGATLAMQSEQGVTSFALDSSSTPWPGDPRHLLHICQYEANGTKGGLLILKIGRQGLDQCLSEPLISRLTAQIGATRVQLLVVERRKQP